MHWTSTETFNDRTKPISLFPDMVKINTVIWSKSCVKSGLFSIRPREKIFVFRVTQRTHVKNPWLTFPDFSTKIGFGHFFPKINCLRSFSFYFSFYSWTATSYSDWRITCMLWRHNREITIYFFILSLPNLITFLGKNFFFRPTDPEKICPVVFSLV